MRKDKKTILVTGGAGFIGTNLCRRLVREGHTVYCLDNLATGSEDNIRDLEDAENFHFLCQDVTGLPCLPADEIYHLACPASPVQYQKNPVRTARTLFQGALAVLELARSRGARVLLASTSEVYGEPLVHPQPESYFGNVNPNGVRSCYDEGKRISETLFFDYRRMFGTDIRVARIFNSYGPFMSENDGRVVSNLVTRALRGEALTVYGSGTQTRCFCYVDDTVEALVRLMAKDDFCGPVNIGNPHEITVQELAEKIRLLTDEDLPITYGALPADDPTRRRPDISLARRELSWEPEISLEDGLKKTIEFFRRQQIRSPQQTEKIYETGLVMGVFDLFHIGHLNLIRRAKSRCRYLRAAVLSDELVLAYKGAEPIIPAPERMEILKSLKDVDEVVCITEDASRIKEWKRRPFDCFFSGDDYRGSDYWQWEEQELKKLGADIVFFPYTKECSSTDIRNRIKE